ncbi:MAG: hypothetical protein LBM96_13225 [Methanobrevibacter sp.]|jgi:hypothetical protein|nr:hypothetical protein [Candidatus Methanoflexus mossambicus]
MRKQFETLNFNEKELITINSNKELNQVLKLIAQYYNVVTSRIACTHLIKYYYSSKVSLCGFSSIGKKLYYICEKSFRKYNKTIKCNETVYIYDTGRLEDINKWRLYNEWNYKAYN